MPSLKTLSQLPPNYEIPIVKENNILDKTLQNISNLFSPRKTNSTLIDKTLLTFRNSISKDISKDKEISVTFRDQVLNSNQPSIISSIKIKRKQIPRTLKTLTDFKPLLDRVKPIEKIARIKLKERFLDKINHKLQCERIRTNSNYSPKSPVNKEFLKGKIILESLPLDRLNLNFCTLKNNMGGGFKTSSPKMDALKSVRYKQSNL